MQTPQVRSLDDAKALYRAEKAKVTTAIGQILGARVLIAVFAAFAIAFGTHLLFAQDRLPTITSVSAAAVVGLPPDFNFGLAGEAAKEASQAAMRQGAGERASAFLAGHPGLAPIINGVGFGASFVLLLWAIWVQSQKRKRDAQALR